MKSKITKMIFSSEFITYIRNDTNVEDDDRDNKVDVRDSDNRQQSMKNFKNIYCKCLTITNTRTSIKKVYTVFTSVDLLLHLKCL